MNFLFQIGLMRSGRLLAEEAPQVLLSIYGCQSLEEVFLKLSRKQQGTESNNLQEVKANNASLVSIMIRVTLSGEQNEKKNITSL